MYEIVSGIEMIIARRIIGGEAIVEAEGDMKVTDTMIGKEITAAEAEAKVEVEAAAVVLIIMEAVAEMIEGVGASHMTGSIMYLPVIDVSCSFK